MTVAELVTELAPGLLLSEVRGVVVAEDGEAAVVGVGLATTVDLGDDCARLNGSTTTASREGVCEREAAFELECLDAGLDVRE